MFQENQNYTDDEELKTNEQLLNDVENEIKYQMERMIDEGKVDYRSDEILIPERIKYIETTITDIIKNCNYPLDANLKVRNINRNNTIKFINKEYDELQEYDRLKISENMMKFIKRDWKEAIYHENRWEIKDETEKYNVDNMQEGMHLAGLRYSTLIPWFYNNYGIDI